MSYPSGWQGALGTHLEEETKTALAACPVQQGSGGLPVPSGKDAMDKGDTLGAGWMCPQAWQEDGAETDPLSIPSAQLSSLRSSRKWENRLQPRETGKVGMHSWSPAGFGQPFGSQPTFQPE